MICCQVTNELQDQRGNVSDFENIRFENQRKPLGISRLSCFGYSILYIIYCLHIEAKIEP